MPPRSVFINLSVLDLETSIKFYTAIGFTKNADLSDPHTTCMALTDVIHVMLHLYSGFKVWIPATKEIADTTKYTEVFTFLSADSKAEVDKVYERAVEAGGKADSRSVDAQSSNMYDRSFEDPDGHVWEIGCVGGEHLET